MRQIVMDGPRRSHVASVPEPAITEDQILVKLTYTGMCHSEWYPWATAKKGDVFGHETVGVIAQTGLNVDGFNVGERVTGLGGGGYKEYIVMDPAKTVHVPDNVKDEDALAEPLACMLSAATKMPLATPGDRIAVVGTGYMGLGMISLFKVMGYGDIVAIDLRQEALANALKFGATEAYHPADLPEGYKLDWPAIGGADLTRDGHAVDIFNIGFQNVVEFAGTESALQLAGNMVCAHGRLGIGGFHNDGPRTIDYALWNFKALTTVNCHERRIMWEVDLSQRCLAMLSKGLWQFTGLAHHVYEMDEFDKANEDMEAHRDGFIKGLVRC
ncbi:MAG: alcohol dehydrogenase catalytic domain-containing protein [Acidimicrobiales bacterium]